MRLNLSSEGRPTLTGVQELASAGRLAAWGTAALRGDTSPDEAAHMVTGPDDPGHRVSGLPDESDPVNLAYALGRLRSFGATGLRLVLPRPGDVAGLPGPPSFNELAVDRGAAVVAVGSARIGLVPDGRAAWAAHRVEPDPRTTMSLRDAERLLGQVMLEAVELLSRLDLARWDPAAAEVLGGRTRRSALPPSVPASAHHVLEQALRVATIVALARGSDGAAVTAGEALARAAVLRDLDDAARRAVEAACSPS